MPSSVTSIGQFPFEMCDSLVYIIFEGEALPTKNNLVTDSQAVYGISDNNNILSFGGDGVLWNNICMVNSDSVVAALDLVDSEKVIDYKIGVIEMTDYSDGLAQINITLEETADLNDGFNITENKFSLMVDASEASEQSLFYRIKMD